MVCLTCLLMQYKFLYEQKIPDDLGGIVNDDYVEAIATILKKSSIGVEELRFGPWDLDTSEYERRPEPEHDSDELDAAFSPILFGKPIGLSGSVHTGPVIDPVVDRIVLRLEQRAATEDFEFARCGLTHGFIYPVPGCNEFHCQPLSVCSSQSPTLSPRDGRGAPFPTRLLPRWQTYFKFSFSSDMRAISTLWLKVVSPSSIE